MLKDLAIMKLPPNELCPCTSGKKYKKCCRRYHQGVSVPTPTDLVRARYSAYALELSDFIMQTTHPDNEEYDSNFDNWRVRVDAYCFRNLFLGLEIVSAEDDKVSYRYEMATFFSEYITEVKEDCVFAKFNDEWKYLSGEITSEEVLAEDD